MHFDDLLGDGEPEAGATLCLGKGAVDLMKLLKDALLLLLGDARSRVRHADTEVTVDHLGSHAYFADVRELNGVADEIEQHLREALLIAGTMGKDLATSVFSASFLFCASDSVAERTVSTTLSSAYSAMFKVNWPDSILAMSSTVLMRPRRCLPLEWTRARASRDFCPSGS